MIQKHLLAAHACVPIQVLAVLCLSSCASKNLSTFPELRSLLPEGKVKTHLMEISYPESFHQLSGRWMAAMRSDPEWALEYIRVNAGGGLLPYHEKMGLSETEYVELLALNESKELTPSSEVSIDIVHRKDGTILLLSEDIPQLSPGVEFSLNDSSVSTHLGRFSQTEVLKEVGEGQGGVFGPYVGYRWHYENGSLELGRGLMFDLIVLERLSDRKRFLHYRGTKLEESVIAEQFEFILAL